jgi:hypothetical protein
MSSVKSPGLTPADLYAVLQTALVEVSENAFFVFVEKCDAGQFAALAQQMPAQGAEAVEHSRAWLKSSVDFVGAFSGSVEIALPERLGLWLVASLLGMSPGEKLDEPQMFDGVGEFTNMVCGACLSRLGDTPLFELRVPAVTRMALEWSPLAEATGRAELASLMVSLNDSPMRVRVLA